MVTATVGKKRERLTIFKNEIWRALQKKHCTCACVLPEEAGQSSRTFDCLQNPKRGTGHGLTDSGQRQQQLFCISDFSVTRALKICLRRQLGNPHV